MDCSNLKLAADQQAVKMANGWSAYTLVNSLVSVVFYAIFITPRLNAPLLLGYSMILTFDQTSLYNCNGIYPGEVKLYRPAHAKKISRKFDGRLSKAISSSTSFYAYTRQHGWRAGNFLAIVWRTRHYFSSVELAMLHINALNWTKIPANMKLSTIVENRSLNNVPKVPAPARCAIKVERKSVFFTAHCE